MGMNVYEAPAPTDNRPLGPEERAAIDAERARARIVVDAMLADDKPVVREKVLDMIFGQRS
jgi:hypothetical protein